MRVVAMLKECMENHHQFTYEEKRVVLYANNDLPTNPSTINANTDLNTLNFGCL